MFSIQRTEAVVMITAMFRLSAKSVLIIAGFFYLIKIISLFLIAGAGKVCAEEGICTVQLREFLIGMKTAPIYIIGAFWYFSLKSKKIKVAAVDRTLSAVFYVHFAWLLSVYFIYITLLAPLAPELLSYYSSPGAKAIRFIDTFIFPIVLLAVFLYWSRRASRDASPCD